MTIIAIAVPVLKTTKLNKLSYPSVFIFLIFWPVTLLSQTKNYEQYLSHWKSEIESGALKPWQILFLIVVAPLALYGLLEGSGDLGSFWFSLMVFLACVGNLLLQIQIVKLLGIV